MIETLITILDPKRGIKLNSPVVSKTYGANEYKNLVKEVCTQYAKESGRIFGNLHTINDICDVEVLLINDFKKSLLNVYNNSTFSVSENEFYLALSTVQNHIRDLANTRISIL